MGVSCEDYNQCQLTQPDLTPHTVRRNIFPWRAHTHIQTRICTHSLSQSVSLSPHLSPSHTHTFSPSFSISLSFTLSLTHTHTHTHSHTHRWMLGAITVSDQAHRHQYRGGDWTKRLSLHIQCVECVLLSPNTRMAGLVSISVTADVIPGEVCVCVCVCV